MKILAILALLIPTLAHAWPTPLTQAQKDAIAAQVEAEFGPLDTVTARYSKPPFRWVRVQARPSGSFLGETTLWVVVSDDLAILSGVVVVDHEMVQAGEWGACE